MRKVTADTITDEQIRLVHTLRPEHFSSEACADALGLPPGPFDHPRTAEQMESERGFQRECAAMIYNSPGFACGGDFPPCGECARCAEIWNARRGGEP